MWLNSVQEHLLSLCECVPGFRHQHEGMGGNSHLLEERELTRIEFLFFVLVQECEFFCLILN